MQRRAVFEKVQHEVHSGAPSEPMAKDMIGGAMRGNKLDVCSSVPSPPIVMTRSTDGTMSSSEMKCAWFTCRGQEGILVSCTTPERVIDH